MLQLKNITKKYPTGDGFVLALNGVNIDFRESEFVSILGPSGCGKTTLLNIIGGLDRYTKGDLLINGKSTKFFKDSHWDTYRNHSVGFVFQSYNLIPHQSVLSNVELALTLSGISKSERRRRAIEALEKVGLGDQIKKKPNQLSGGQMQRVAIARAIVNDPDILLADEPTGALDTHTSIQIMEILREIAKDKLVIMVTHNPELAEEYSTRIVKLLDGRIIDDSNPFEAPTNAEEVVRKTNVKKGKRASMSFLTAFALSINNLMTKKGRTFMTSFAGSIGIIGIALILSLSSGINAYIALVQEDTLSTYPLTLQKETQDYSAMLQAMTSVSEAVNEEIDPDKIYVDDSLGTMMSAMSATISNDLESFKAYIDQHYDEIKDAVSDIQYTYDFDLQIFTEDGKTQVSPTTIFDNMGSAFSGITELMETSGMSSAFSVMSEMINNQELLDQQYELVGEGSRWPENPNEVVLVINKNNQISKMTLYMLGVLPQDELEEIMKNLMAGGEYDSAHMEEYELSDFLGMKFRLLNTSDFFTESDTLTYEVDGKTYPVWRDLREDIGYDQEKFVTENGTELTISGIIRPREGVAATSISGAIGYTKGLTDYILAKNTESSVINQQKVTPDYNVLTGLKFERTVYTPETISDLVSKIDDATMESFYAYMTEMILNNPEYSDRLVVKDTESFLGFYLLMSQDQQAELMTSILNAAKTNSTGVSTLMTMLGMMNPTITITEANFIQLLPVLSTETKMLALMGLTAEQSTQLGSPMPMEVPGLIALAGEEAMASIYTGMTERIKTMSVNDEIFLALLGTMSAEDEAFKTLEETLYKMAPQTDANYDSTLKALGDAEKASPASINLYAKDFASKDLLVEFIDTYNQGVDEIDQIKYTDVIGILMSSVSIIINVISYVLIAFVSISLVVSSIMIGIITYISVLERTKEIGILRAMGASKKDIARVFNAETLIVGLIAGLIGIISTVILCIPINAIVRGLSGISQITAFLPWQGAIILVAISVALTIIAGLIPSYSASKKDPVVALRTE